MQPEFPIRQEFERRFADLIDFHAALRFADLLLPLLEPEERNRHDVYEPLAFWTALVVAYARPFTMNLDRAGFKEPRKFSLELKARIPAGPLGDRHHALIDARHRVMAHSDRRVERIKRFLAHPGSDEWVAVLDGGPELPPVVDRSMASPPAEGSRG